MDLRSYVKEVERNYREGQNIFRRKTVGYLLQMISDLEQGDNRQAKPTHQNLKVLVYELDGYKDLIEVRLECVKQMDGSCLWAIREKGCCLNKQGRWEVEPIPSSRTSAFFKRCRWESAEAALEFWSTGQKSRFEHYRKESF